MGLAERILPVINDVGLAPASDLRRALLARARGTVVEIGFGTGMNAPLYPPAVERVLAVEPSVPMWRRGAARARDAGLAVERIDAFGERLPLARASADVAVSTFVLCSVRDPAAVLAELARVVRPGGELLLLEHVASPRPLTRRLQRAVTPLWRACLAGCHPGRDLVPIVHASLWTPVEERFERLAWLPRVVEHHVVGAYRNG